MVLKQQAVAMRDGLDIGIGVDMATGSPMGKGVEGHISPPEVGTGSTATFVFRRIDQTSDIESALGISAEVSAGIGLFGASASFDFAKECRIRSSSLAVMVRAEERFAFLQMDEPALTEGAGSLVDKPDTFASKFGNYFVRGISTGGRFVGVVRIDTNSLDSKLSVDASLNASYGIAFDAEARLRLTESLRQAEATVAAFVFSEGGVVTSRPTSRDPNEMLSQLFTAIEQWTATVREQPKAYEATLAPYAIALGPEPPNPKQLERQRDVLIRCAKLRSQTLDKLNQVDYILDPAHTDEFAIVAPPDGPDLSAIQVSWATDLDAIADAASFAIDNVADACDPETYMRTRREPPIADFSLTPLPPNMPAHTGPPSVTNRKMANMTDYRSVLLVGGLRTQAELEAMSIWDMRNTVITELTNRTNQPVGYYQGMEKAEVLAGAGALVVFVRNVDTVKIGDSELKAMSDDDVRNHLIVRVNQATGLSIPNVLQAMTNLDLVDTARKIFC